MAPFLGEIGHKPRRKRDGGARRRRAVTATLSEHAPSRPKPAAPTLADPVENIRDSIRDSISSGMDLLGDFVSSRRREDGLLSDQVKRAAIAGDPLAIRILKTGILGELAQWTDRRR